MQSQLSKALPHWGGRFGQPGDCSDSGIDSSCADAARGAGCLLGHLVSQSHSENSACNCFTCKRKEGPTCGSTGWQYNRLRSALLGAGWKRVVQAQPLPSRRFQLIGVRGRKCRLGLCGDQGKSGRVYLRKTQYFHDNLLVSGEHGDRCL